MKNIEIQSGGPTEHSNAWLDLWDIPPASSCNDSYANLGDSTPFPACGIPDFDRWEIEGLAADQIRKLRSKIKSKAEVKRRKARAIYKKYGKKMPVDNQIDKVRTQLMDFIGDYDLPKIKLGKKLSAKGRRNLRDKLNGLDTMIGEEK